MERLLFQDARTDSLATGHIPDMSDFASLSRLVALGPLACVLACSEPNPSSSQSVDAPAYRLFLEEALGAAQDDAAFQMAHALGVDALRAPQNPARAGWTALAPGEYASTRLLAADSCGSIEFGPVEPASAVPGMAEFNTFVLDASASSFSFGRTVPGSGVPAPFDTPEECVEDGAGFVCEPEENLTPGSAPFWPGGPYDATIIQSVERAGVPTGSDAFFVVQRITTSCEGEDCDAFIQSFDPSGTSPDPRDCVQFSLSRETEVTADPVGAELATQGKPGGFSPPSRAFEAACGAPQWPSDFASYPDGMGGTDIVGWASNPGYWLYHPVGPQACSAACQACGSTGLHQPYFSPTGGGYGWWYELCTCG